MIRQIITIDEEKCDGCGICVEACVEGALAIVNGKAKLIKEDHCDGLGNCLPGCPKNAISFETREAAPFNEAILESIPMCPSSNVLMMDVKGAAANGLRHWPIKIDLVPVKAAFMENSKLLVAADCTAFAYPDMQREIANGGAVVIGCPKLDSNDHTEKLTEIIKANSIREIMILRMEVPCCGALDRVTRTALLNSGKSIPIKTVIVSRSGQTQTVC